MQTTSRLTDAQHELVTDMDDVSEHVAYEFDADEYEGVSTCGFAHIHNISGNSSFVRRVQSLSKSDHDMVEHNERRDTYQISVGRLELSLRSAYDGGYRLSITNVSDYRSGPEHQRMDVRERLHRLVLDMLQEHGYLEDAWVKSRMD